MAYCVFKESSSPVKAISFNPLSPDLLTLYRRLNPIKIWPTYAVPPTTTLYPRSTYDLWRAGSSPTIFQPVEKLIPLTATSQSGPDQSPLYFRPTYALPDQGPLIADLSIFPERERAGVDRVSGVNGPLQPIIGDACKLVMMNGGTLLYFGQRSRSTSTINVTLSISPTYIAGSLVQPWSSKRQPRAVYLQGKENARDGRCP